MQLRYFDEVEYIKLGEDARKILSKPLDKLYRADELEELRLFIENISSEERVYATVGDRVTKTFLDWGYTPHISVIDCLERRRPVNLVDHTIYLYVIYVENKRGFINMAISKILRDYTGKYPLLIKVGGEEDLVGIPVILSLSQGSYVFYGQPGEGIVSVRITIELKRWIKKLIFQGVDS